MGLIDKIFRKGRITSEEELENYLELDIHGFEEYAPELKRETYVKVMNFNDETMVPEIIKDVREGNILILNIKSMASKNLEMLKKSIDEIKTNSLNMGGDIGLLSEDRVIVTPKNVKILRKR
ncbi:MAG: cell division protein SepF [Candidatus Hydrothermarchaeota archaeon]